VIGQTLGHYRIDAPLGAGGMGVVYRAYDLRLERPVAVKLLRDDDARSARARRLLNEARHASRLNHPAVCTVHEVGEHEGQTFIVMELVPGRPLADVIPREGLPADKLLHYAVQITDAVAHAHERGVLHRDLKSANVMVLPDDRVKILDFGIAEALNVDAETVTRSLSSSEELSGVHGTLPYLAPEILNGRAADPRSDIWSLAVMLYEMATGRHPFGGATAFALTSAILTEPPAPFTARDQPALGGLILKCLSKNPAARHDSARAVLAVLDSMRGEGGAAAVPAPASRSIAVLPFKDLARSPDDVHLGLGLADAVITELASVRSLIVRPTSAIVRYQETDDPRAAGRELGVDALVEGSFQRLGPRLRVTVQLSDVLNGRSLWGTRVTTSFDDLFALQDEVSQEIVAALKIELTEAEEQRLGRSAQPSADAYEHYLRGRVHLFTESRGDLLDAVAAFERATAIDPRFALAWAGLSDACWRLGFTCEPEGNWYERAERMCARALELSPTLPEGHYLQACLLWTPQRGFQHRAAIRELAAAISGKPNLSEGHHWLGIILLHVSLLEESSRHFDRALAIAPEDFVASFMLGFCSYLDGDFEAAVQISRAARQRHPATHWVHYQLAMSQIQLKALDEAERTLEFWSHATPGDVLQEPIKGLLAALRGDVAQADRHIDATVAGRRGFGHYHHAQYDVACIYALTGRAEAALDWLRAAAGNGFPCARFFRRDPLLASLHSEPRFMGLISTLDAECAGYRALYNEVCGSS
jgi:serine/threonine protein kinase/tetratricopeptide (TPR) repeat protein